MGFLRSAGIPVRCGALGEHGLPIQNRQHSAVLLLNLPEDFFELHELNRFGEGVVHADNQRAWNFHTGMIVSQLIILRKDL